MTVAEVIMALGILATAILAIVAGFLGALELNSRSVEMAVATQVGRDFLERVKEQGYDRVPEGTFTFRGASNDPRTALGFPPDPYPRVTANERDHCLLVRVGTKGATLKVVSVEVTWGTKGRIILETYLYPGFSVS
jgi:hypothetical protein